MQTRNRDEDSRADAAQCRPQGTPAGGPNEVMIYRCPNCPRLRELADGVAARMGTEAETTAAVADGQAGEFRVVVNGYSAYDLAGPTRPTADEVLEAVHESVRSRGCGPAAGAPLVGKGEGI